MQGNVQERFKWDKERMIEPKLFAEGQDGHNFIYFKGPVPPFPLIAQRDFVIQTF